LQEAEENSFLFPRFSFCTLCRFCDGDAKSAVGVRTGRFYIIRRGNFHQVSGRLSSSITKIVKFLEKMEKTLDQTALA
jgi:hypothetical protein